LSSDDDTLALGNANNPIVLDSDDEAEHSCAEPVSAIPPLLEAISLRKNSTQLVPSNISQSRQSPSNSSHTSDEQVSVSRETFLENEYPTTCQPLLSRQSPNSEPPLSPAVPSSPRPGMHSGKPVTPTVTTQTQPVLSPLQDGYESLDKAGVPTAKPTGEGPSPASASLSPRTPESQKREISRRLAAARLSSSVHTPSSPDQDQGDERHNDASVDASHVPIRGTLYSGPSGLWKDFFKAATAKSVSPPGPSHGRQVKEVPNTPQADSPCKMSPMLVSPVRKGSNRASCTPQPVAERGSPEISDKIVVASSDNTSSAPTCESQLCYSRANASTH
jgi:hypothetical protein